METKRLPRLMALLRQRPHGKALLSGDCEGTLRFYQSRQGVLSAVELHAPDAEGFCTMNIEGVEQALPALPLCQGYGCMIFLSDDFSLHDVTGKTVSLFDAQGRLLAQGRIRSWDSL